MKETVLFKSEEKMARSDVTAALRTIADKLDSGQLVLSMGEDHVSLEIPENVTLELKAEEEAGRRGETKKSLEIEIEWMEGQEKESKAPAKGVTIS